MVAQLYFGGDLVKAFIIPYARMQTFILLHVQFPRGIGLPF